MQALRSRKARDWGEQWKAAAALDWVSAWEKTLGQKGNCWQALRLHVPRVTSDSGIDFMTKNGTMTTLAHKSHQMALTMP